MTNEAAQSFFSQTGGLDECSIVSLCQPSTCCKLLTQKMLLKAMEREKALEFGELKSTAVVRQAVVWNTVALKHRI